MSSTKIVVTVPTETFDAVERVRRRLGKSRSAAVAIALHEWLRGLEAREADRRYIEAYLRQPERMDEVRAIAAQATAHWAPWEPGKQGRLPAREPREQHRRARAWRRASR